MTKRKIAIAAAFATLVVAPAFAMDQDTAAVTINSGRYLPELHLTAARARVPANAFALVQPGRVPSVAPTGARDFQLQGRGLGE
jgi:hypothetical protein